MLEPTPMCNPVPSSSTNLPKVSATVVFNGIQRNGEQDIQGVYPFYSDTYDITKHPKYKHLSGHDKKNTFDPKKYLSRLPRNTAVL
jgi:hypothetical protein